MPIAAFVGGYIAGRLSPTRGMLKGALTFAPAMVAFLLGVSAEFLVNRIPLAQAAEIMLKPLHIWFVVLLILGMAGAIAGGAFGTYTAKRTNRKHKLPIV